MKTGLNIVRQLELKRQAQGFTLLETVILLALIGMIMVVIFFAIPQVQRSARDNERQSIARNIMDAIDNYALNNDGQLPSGDLFEYTDPSCKGRIGQFCDFYQRYIMGKVNDKDPSTGKSVFDWEIEGGKHTADMDPCILWTDKFNAGDPCNNHYDWNVTGFPERLHTGDISLLTEAKCDGNTPVSTGVYAPIGPGSVKNDTSYVVLIGLDRPGTFLCLQH